MPQDDINAFKRNITEKVLLFNLYPVIPRGNLSIEFIESVFSFDPYYILEYLKNDIRNGLPEDLWETGKKIYEKYESRIKKGMLDALINDFRSNIKSIILIHNSLMTLRINETLIFYYAFSIFYIACDIKNSAGLKFSQIVLDTLKLMKCEKTDNAYINVEKGGKMLDLPEFRRDKAVYEKMRDMIKNELKSLNEETAVS